MRAMCVSLQKAAHWRRRVRAIWGSSSFCSCWCKILEALMADDAKSSQKLLSPIGDPRMTKLGTFELVVVASSKSGKVHHIFRYDGSSPWSISSGHVGW